MKVIITNVHSQENRGDAAILSSTMEILKSENIQASLLTLHSVQIFQSKSEQPITENLFWLKNAVTAGRAFKLLEVTYVILTSILWAIIYRLCKLRVNFFITNHLRRILESYISADFILPVGGGYLTAKQGVMSTIFYAITLFPIFLGALLSKRIILLPQSVGPFANRTQALISKWVLNQVNTIYVREKYSLELLNKIGIHKPDIQVTGDCGFLFSSSQYNKARQILSEQGINLSRPVIGITARYWFPKSSEKHSEYVELLTSFISKVLAENKQVLLIPQVTSALEGESDASFLAEVKSKFNHTQDVLLLKGKVDHFLMKSVYENLDFLLGTRMHSVIFALTSGVPCIAIAYEHKTQGIMEDLNLSKWVVDINSLERGKIEDLYDELIREKSSYLDCLKSNMDQYQIELNSFATKLNSLLVK